VHALSIAQHAAKTADERAVRLARLAHNVASAISGALAARPQFRHAIFETTCLPQEPATMSGDKPALLSEHCSA
jgi:hypothetical protein